MTKLQFLKIFILNLIFGATVIAGDLPRETEPKLRTTVVKVDSEFKLPKGAICVAVPRGTLVGLEKTEEDGKRLIRMDPFSLSKAIRDSHKMSHEENEKLQSYIFDINENRMDEKSMVLALNEAVENGHLAIVRLLSTYCHSEDVDVISGKTPKLGKTGSVKVIICSKKALGKKDDLTIARFRARIGHKEVERKGFANGG